MLRSAVCYDETHPTPYFLGILKHKEQGRAKLQEEVGCYHGQLAPILGLNGTPKPKDFRDLGYNWRPGTDRRERLTLRTKPWRRVIYDFSFHSPKGLSLLSLLMRDEEILPVFRAAVSPIMMAMEKEVCTRVRKGGKNELRVTGNMLWVDFDHFNSRPVGGVPFPQLHNHSTPFVATWDPVEQVIKAAEMGRVCEHLPYYEASFHARLALAVRGMGYELRREGKWWDVAGIPPTILDLFSPRSAVIEAAQARKGITTAKGKAKVAVMTREKKTKHTLDELLPEWLRLLGTPGVKTLEKVVAMAKARKGQLPPCAITAEAALAHAWGLPRPDNPSPTRYEIMTDALWYGLGQVTVEAIETQMLRWEMIHGQLNEAWEFPAQPVYKSVLPPLVSSPPVLAPTPVAPQPDDSWDIPAAPAGIPGQSVEEALRPESIPTPLVLPSLEQTDETGHIPAQLADILVAEAEQVSRQLLPPEPAKAPSPSAAPTPVAPEPNESWDIPAQPATAAAVAETPPDAPLDACLFSSEEPGSEKNSEATPEAQGEPPLDDNLPDL